MSDMFKLYGIPGSLYTAKARSYLRKQGIPFIEHSVANGHYQQAIIPLIGRMIMPVVETPTGEIWQDSADIIRQLESKGLSAIPAIPESPVLKAISYLFELFAGEGLLKPAMHYRWNFDEINLDYLRSEFSCLAPPGLDADSFEQLFQFASGRMRQAAILFGASAESAPGIESSYPQFLSLFDAHLKAFPYLLGGQPTLGDYALMGPLYAHLSRDPAPGQLMRRHAPRVSRWIERMNTTEACWADHEGMSDTLIAEDAIPETLQALMRYIHEEYQPEILAHIAFANHWLAERPDLAGGSNGLDDPTGRIIGKAEFDWRGIRLRTAVMPYRFYLLQYLQDHYDAIGSPAREKIASLFEQCGLAPILSHRTSRRVERQNYLEVWGAA